MTGANIGWSNAAGGAPAPGLTTYGTMTTGPALLHGLWNAGSSAGTYPVTLDVSPANAFNVLSTSGGWNPNFTIAEAGVAPEMNTHTLYLPAGHYALTTELSDYRPVSTALAVSGPQTLHITLAQDPGMGIYTPLWAFSNSEIAAISSGGHGTPNSPYVVDNNQHAPIGATFGLYNDYGFPAYPAVFLLGTTASTEFLNPPSFETATNTFAYPGPYLPSTNDLQYWFWNVSGVSIVGAQNISGWFDANTFYPAVFDTFSVIFYEGGHNLVAGNTFDSEGQGLLMFSGGTLFGPLNVGGGNNTVWGNSFFQVPTPNSTLELLPGAYGIGIELAESNDTIYNNYVATPTTAWLLPLNLYSGYPEFFSDAFNITPQAASVTHYASGFPYVPLRGSIIGTSWQGGNYWWDYGLTFNPYNGADNPYGVLPYDENASTLLVDVYGPAYYYATYIYPGGDYAPLVPAISPVTFHETGLSGGLTWGAELFENGLLLGGFETTAPAATLDLQAGTYEYLAISPTGWHALGPSPGTFRVGDRPLTVPVTFRVLHGDDELTFSETGLRRGENLTVTVNGTGPSTWAYNATETTSSGSLVFAVAPGTYVYTVAPVAGRSASPSSGSVAVSRNTDVRIRFTPVFYAVSFTESGLPAGTAWEVRIAGHTYRSTSPTIVVEVPSGTYAVHTYAPHGYALTAPLGSITVTGGSAAETLSFASG